MHPTIVLNMIVKNESKIITRLFDSVLPIIDFYCICDTGSTDNTIDVIRDYFTTKGIPGKVVTEPFRDFGYNRSFALSQCDQGDYVLLLDADMVLQFGPKFNRDQWYENIGKYDAHLILQGSSKFNYKNIRIVRNHMHANYWGVTHEYLVIPNGKTQGSFDASTVFINDIGDGGSKTDKFIRDIRLLTKGLEENPGNHRYTFYLANSYRDSGQKTKAIEIYKQRIQLGGWIEEVWYSCYSIGMLYKDLGCMEKAIFYWMEAFTKFNKRIDNLYEIVHYYRSNCAYELAYMFYAIADEKRRQHNDDFLFMDHTCRNFKLDYEMSIIGYYVNPDRINMARLCMRLLNSPDADRGHVNNVLSNFKYYCRSATDFPVNSLIQCRLIDGFTSSTPSICELAPNRYAVNTRFVNYRIDEKGNYSNPAVIETVNIVSVYDGSWNRMSPDVAVLHDVTHDGHYKGIEDIRLLAIDGKLLYNGNRGVAGRMLVEHGEIDIDTGRTTSLLLHIEQQQSVEKNWVLFADKCIYSWFPLTIGSIGRDGELDDICVRTTPLVFERLRGSTNGVRIGDEYWFLCHMVSYEDRRYYYHMFVAIDATTHEVTRFSQLFTFEKAAVEYTLGFVDVGDHVLVGYSCMDSSTKYKYIPKEWIFSE